MAPGSKSRLTKAAGAEPCCGAKRVSKSKCAKPVSFRELLLRWGKSERRCGAKHILKSKRTKHTTVGLEVEMLANARRCGAKHTSKLTENEQIWWILILPLHATSCHFEWRATSSGVCHFKWRATSSGMPLRVACRTLSTPLHATSSGASHREHATSCHVKWCTPLQEA